jgi:predicted dehydrogenase
LLHKVEAEDTALALLKFESGASTVLQGTTAAFPGSPRRLEVTGTEGTVVLEQDRVIAVDLKHPREGVASSPATHDIEDTASPVVTDFQGHQAVFEDFIRAIKRRRHAPVRWSGSPEKRSSDRRNLSRGQKIEAMTR